ncbi:MAG TPA: hypothetical protein PLV72_00480 [Candidatus Magasanikbacteria bacterium]|nr:hypothetical protein [Candidatus Magasanikbacteria bacterium]
MGQKIGFFSREAIPIWKDLACEALVVVGFFAGLAILAISAAGAVGAYFAYAFDPIVHWFVQLGALGWPGFAKGFIQMMVEFILPWASAIGAFYACLLLGLGGYHFVEVILHKLNPEKNLRPVW